MTSNVGADAAEAGSLGFDLAGQSSEEYAYNASKEAYKRAMEDFFKPEFLNRLDDVIVFRPLEKEEQREVVIMESQYLVNRVEAQGISLTFSDTAIDFLLDKGYNPRFGARPIRRAIEQYVEPTQRRSPSWQ